MTTRLATTSREQQQQQRCTSSSSATKTTTTKSITVLLSIFLIGIEIISAAGLHNSLLAQQQQQQQHRRHRHCRIGSSSSRCSSIANIVNSLRTSLPLSSSSSNTALDRPDSHHCNNDQSVSPSTITSTQQQQQQPLTAAASTVQMSQQQLRGGGGGSNAVTATPAAGTLSKIRQAIFPIYGQHEITKFLLLGTIKFFIILALTLTRDTKDTLVVTQCGAEALAFIKIYGVLPAATAFIALYSKLSNVLGKRALFYTTCIPFFVFFLLYDLFIYPNAHFLHPSLETVQALIPGAAAASGGGLAVMAKIMSHWTSALFYVMAEIYSSVSVGLLFWQFANDVVSVSQAKRFYPLFAQMSGLAPVVAGQFVVHYASKAPSFADSMHRLTAAVSIAGIMICVYYHLAKSYIDRTESNQHDSGDSSEKQKKKKKKAKMSMMESAKFLASSQYLRLIATLVLGYGLSINFTEIMWKSLVKKRYPNPLDYQRFMGNFSSAVGISTCIVIFFGVQVIRILGWRIGAMMTPAVMAILSLPFFGCILLGLDESPSRLQLAVLFGTIQSLLSKTAKYALFDPTTQMAYIPLDEDSKVKGKAAIDVLGSRIGKSGGSFIQQGLVFVFGNILNAAPVVGVIFYSVLLAWMGAANRLSTLFQAQTDLQEEEEQEPKQQQKVETKKEQ